MAVPDLGGIYDRSAQTHGPDRNPVIVIPGILGSKLRDGESGRVVWGACSGEYANPERPDGARLVAVPMEPGTPVVALKDGVRSDGALDRLQVSLVGLPIELDAYRHILGTLGAGGYRDQELGESGAIDYGDDHFTCFQFDYDWRLDNVANAKRLHAFILEKRAYVQGEYARRYGVTDADVNFDIVAHSMGGLVTRYYLRYGDADVPATGTAVPTWAGAEHVDRVILVGTPSAGSAESVVQLVRGIKFAFFLPKYRAALLGTMPSIYQLLPRPRHDAVRDENGQPIDGLDPAVWERYGWGLADPGEDDVLAVLLPDVNDPAERRAIALDHQRKCLDEARRFFAALDVPATPPAGTDIYLMTGDAEPTAAVVQVDAAGGVTFIEAGPGDGTVLRSSALMDERVGGTWTPTLQTPIAWRGVTFSFADHLGLTMDPMFTDNVLYLLLEAPR
jgi:pimeloyl-ACP methyl ester carboxylesterase